MDTLVISIQSKSSDATKAIGKLVSSLKQLRKELDNISVASKGLSNLKVNASVGTHVTARGRSTSGNKRQIPSLEEQLKQYNLKESDLKQIGGTFAYDRNISRFKSVAGDLVTITEKNANGLKTYRVAVKQATKDLPTLSSKFDELKSSMGGVYLKTTAILGTMTLLAKKSADFVKEAGASEEALNLFVVSMGDYAKEGVQWIDKFSKALYLDPVQVQQYMGSFNSLVEGLGVGSDNAYIMSKNLTQLVYDLSSFKNISISSAYEKLMSGISGELEPLILVAIICEYYRKRSEPTNVGCGKKFTANGENLNLSIIRKDRHDNPVLL